EEVGAAAAVVGDSKVNRQELALRFSVEELIANSRGALADTVDGDAPVVDGKAVADAEAFAAIGILVSGWLFRFGCGLILSGLVLRSIFCGGIRVVCVACLVRFLIRGICDGG